MMKYLVEFVGTFFFLSVILNSGGFGNMGPFVVATGLLGAVLFGGKVSGGHFNPAVSAMMFAKNSIDMKTLGFYVCAQLFGSLAAWQFNTLAVKA